MKSCLLVLLNRVFFKDLELMYGEGSYVDVLSVKYCTTNHYYLIDCKLFLSNIDLFSEFGVDGLKILIEECWKYVGVQESKIATVITYDIV